MLIRLPLSLVNLLIDCKLVLNEMTKKVEENGLVMVEISIR